MKNGLAFALIFMLSFMSLTYELLLARLLADLSRNEILAQSLGIGLFLLGLGAGTGLSTVWQSPNPLRRLFLIEGGLIVLVTVLAPLALGVAFLSQLIEAPASVIYLTVGSGVFLVGLLSGFEFPLVMSSLGKEAGYHLALGWSYFGGLFAGFAVPLLLNPNFGPALSLSIVALLNFSVMVLVWMLNSERTKRQWLFAFAPAATMFAGLTFLPHVEQAFLKSDYFQLRIPELRISGIQNIWAGMAGIPHVERHYSAYQKIDFVRGSQNSNWATEPRDGVILYLDRRLQFNEATQRLYHQSMTIGSFHLAQKIPAKVLVLGGGDGLLVAELLKFPEVREIEVVELDPKMIELANSHYDLLRLNRGALKDPRVKVHVDDAFAFLKKVPTASQEAILIDFPYPHSPELLRLYSREFYSIVKRVLTDRGFAVLDGPIYTEEEKERASLSIRPQALLVKTLQSAGFGTVFPFGSYEGFYFVQKEFRQISFRYPELPEHISNQALVNLRDMSFELSDSELEAAKVNSLFRPRSILPLGR